MHKRVVKILTGLAIVAVVLAVVYFLWVASSTAKLHRAYQALEEAGRPMSKNDVIPQEVPDEDNAALLYESAMLLLRSQRIGEHGLIRYLSDLSTELIENPSNAEKRAEIETLLQQDVVVNALQAVEMGSKRPVCRFDINYGAGLAMRIPPLNYIRSISRILSAKAYLQAQAGQIDEAWNTVYVQLKHADALRNQPTIISQLVRLAQIGFSFQTIRVLCDTTPPTDDHYRDIDSLLETFDDMAPLVRAVDGERLLFGEVTYDLSQDELKNQIINGILGESHAPTEFLTLKSHIATFKPLLLADHATYLRAMLENTQQLLEPYEPQKTLVDEEKLFQDTQRYTITSQILPAMRKLKELYLKMIAETRVTRGGLALLQYKQTHGTFPETLEALTQTGLDDPFRQGALHYQVEGQGFILYSVGPDRKDDGGQAKQKNQDTDYDILWRFPTPSSP